MFNSFQNKIMRAGAGIAIIATLALPFAASAQVTTTAATAAITSNLAVGSRGAQVTALQTFLATDPSVYPSGSVTGYFGTLTKDAVIKFQAKYGIDQVGSVGPMTRAKINALMTGGGTVGTSGPGVSPAILSAVGSLTTPAGTAASTTVQTATISWSTDRATTGKVFYSPTPLTFTENSSSNSEPVISGSVMTDATLSATKQITLSNLVASTTYYYMIEAIDGNGNVSVTWPATVVSQ